MTGVLNDSEEQRVLDRIRRMIYNEIQDEMIARMESSVITRQ